MFLRSSCIIYPGLYLLTLGATCRYAIVGDDNAITLTDPGASLHIAPLEERLARLNLSIENVKNVLITHLDADRVAGIALLRRRCPQLKVFGTATMRSALKRDSFVQNLWEKDQAFGRDYFGVEAQTGVELSEFKEALRIDHPLVEADSIAVGEDLAIRSLATPGHREHSVSYLLVPHEFVIADETMGYYRGSKLAAPGADFDLQRAVASIARFEHVEISGIGFSYVGAITGTLARKHLTALTQNSTDLVKECQKARTDGVPVDEIVAQVKESLYAPIVSDPFLIESMNASFNAVVKQLSL